MGNVATHYRQAEDLLGEAERLASLIPAMAVRERAALLMAAAGVHALLALAPPTAVAGAQRERDQE